MRRVVVTGLGTINPLGNTVETSWNSLINSKSGISKITNFEFLRLIQQTSNWLNHNNIKPKDRVILPDIGSPQTEILLFGVWGLGASAILSKQNSIKNIKSYFKESI